MGGFLETTFGPAEFEIVNAALAYWLNIYGVPKTGKDAEIAGAVAINLFREGYRTETELFTAMERHQGLKGLVADRAA